MKGRSSELLDHIRNALTLAVPGFARAQFEKLLEQGSGKLPSRSTMQRAELNLDCAMILHRRRMSSAPCYRWALTDSSP
eukprot:874078-Pyramimonas_sp.AAC.1